MAKCNKCGKSGMFLKVNQNGLCLDCASSELAIAQSQLTPEVQELAKNQEYVNELLQKQEELKARNRELAVEIDTKNDKIRQLDKEIINLDDEILVQQFGLYKPQFDFAKAEIYKEKLMQNRQHQKDLIKSNHAVTGATNWTVNGDYRKGSKMVTDMQKLLL